MDGLVYVPAQDDAVHLVRRNVSLAKEISQVGSVSQLSSFSKIFDMLDIPDRSRLILEKDVIPVSRFDYLQKISQNKFEFSDGSTLFRQLRSVKSEFEITQINSAAQLVDRMFEFCIECATPDMKEIELAANLSSFLLSNGHAGYITTRTFNALNLQYSYVISSGSATSNILFTPISGHGLSAKYPFGGSRRKLGKNNPFFIDTCGNHNGYISDTTRTFTIGHFDRDTKDQLNSLQAIKTYITTNLKPGTSLGQLFESVIELSKELGIDNNFMGSQADKSPFLGHGVGLELDELPIFYKKGHSLEPGHVLASEPKFIIPNHKVLGIEDTYAITTTGNTILSQAPDFYEI